MYSVIRLLAITAILFHGAIFGFFYAWICSTMWGLDTTSPEIAIAAMQAMNASVRNITFAPAFFATPAISLLTAILCLIHAQRIPGMWFGAAGLVYLFGGLTLTMSINVPMNEALATVAVPNLATDAAQVWADYSAPWQFWNQMRTIFSGIALVMTAIGLLALGRSMHHTATTTA